ncbi:flagellar biosynthesis protein FlhF [Neobacillus sp. 114]|uniref:flagellar biosynthesis protein FlhF n=1 Tax=Neobacillus sp. 114 TaxID=3048535 RepID=UPI0024C33469|nr:flagellar biosynthesis protein FlhF [Neobacillus sp. 114]
MKIKTYVVNSLVEAYPLILRDLGKDAMILKQKVIKAPGLFGMFRKRKLEVVAASDLADEPSNSSRQELKEEINKELIPSEVVNESAIVSQDVLLKELSEVKGLIRSITNTDNRSQSIPEPLAKWVERLQDQEVDEEVIQYILKRVEMKEERIDELPSERIEEMLVSILVQLIEEGIAKDAADSTPYLITLVGPTGVGKTTTLAKLAAARVLNGRLRVGLLTADTYRIGAVEQLKTYANILNIPIEVVTTPDDLQPAINGLKGCQMILMDSAGRNYLEDQYIDEINQYLGYEAPQENYLVLSMTTRWRDMKKITEKMKSVPIDKLILTKWDETTCYGAALNMLYHFPYPLAYLCIGQGVPQDIMTANPEFMAKKILGVDEHATRSSLSFETVI